MKRLLLAICLLPALGMLAWQKDKPVKTTTAAKPVTWYTWQQAVELNKTAPRKFMIDVYTDWCGWCKKMDKETFTNDTIAEYLNQHFYCVKLNAEMHDSLKFGGKTYTWISPEKGGGSNGIHTFALWLLNGRMAYPNLVYMNEKLEHIVVSPGYKEPARLLPELRFSAEDIYKTKSLEAYKNQSN